MMPAESADNRSSVAGRRAVRSVGPRMRVLFNVVLALVAVTAANSVYLGAITLLEWISRRWGDGRVYQDQFYLLMFLFHLAVGFLLIVPFVIFAAAHMRAAWRRRNRHAVRIGFVLFGAGLVLLLTGVLLVRIEGVFDMKLPQTRAVVYWLHVLLPLAVGWLYWLHRLAGPRIQWGVGLRYVAVAGVVVAAMVVLQLQDPRSWFAVGPREGARYFEPSLARTSTGHFIPASTLMMDDYCLKCHKDAYDGWYHSVHHFSSFNNPAYLAAVRETRTVSLKRDGSTKASRWCAGCHDPVPFFSGAFDDPHYDDVKSPTAQAGITCTACHAITNVNSTRGNADYTIEEPLHYPLASSRNGILQFINHTLVRAKPSFHKQTFLKPFHKTAEFCSTCHKVHLPKAVTHYKEFLRGQNHYDPYLLSGVSGHSARSFYYPTEAKENCSACHMPPQPSQDFGAKMFAGADRPSIHNHLFPGANTAIAWFRDEPKIVQSQQEFLRGAMRVDVFGIKEDAAVDGKLHAPLRPEVPALEPGRKYLVETVVRTLKVGHLFTQGTADSNEVWLDVRATSGDREIGRSGAIDAAGEVDRWSHFVNMFMLDRDGNRIDRRNAQDIFVPLYNNQIPPGAARVVHYELDVPPDVTEPVRVSIALKYRKFDKEYTDFMARSVRPGDLPLRGYREGISYRNELPITVLAEDVVVFPLKGSRNLAGNPPRGVAGWERWNDYGIGLFLEGKAELRQAADAFAEVEKAGRCDGPLNLARVLHREGRLAEAVEAIRRAAALKDPPPPSWTLAWLSGMVGREQGHLDDAERNLRGVLETMTQEMRDRRFDFSLDIEVINLLGLTLFDRANREVGGNRRDARNVLLREAVAQFERTLQIDSEDVTAHHNLQLLYGQLGDRDKETLHRELHIRYKPDDNARDRAFGVARRTYPAANHAAETLVIYPLARNPSPVSPSAGH